MPKLSFQETLTLICILLITLLARLHILFLVRTDPAFLMPIVDSLEYDIWAYKIYSEGWFWDVLPYHLPLYPYFLAGIYSLFGYNLSAVAFIQYLLACVVSVLVFFIVRRLKDTPTAFITILLMGLYWFFCYAQTFLFSENLSLLFNVLLIFLLVFLKDRPVKYFAAGIVLGLSVISRPDILTFAGVIIAWLLLEHKFSKKTAVYYSVFLTGLFFALAPVILRNASLSNEPIFLRTQVGVNMYIGNRPDFKGQAAVGIGKEWEETISLPHKTYRRQVSESESDRFFVQETLKIIREQPAEWSRLIAGKIFSILSGRDFLRTEDVYFYNNYILRTPYFLISTRLLFILFIAGMVISWRERRKYYLLYFFLLAELGIIFFQIKTRYLLPVFPFVIFFSSLTLRELGASFKAGDAKKTLKLTLWLIMISLITLINPLNLKFPSTAETHYAVAKAYTARQQWENAEKQFLWAHKIDPQNVSVLNDLGVLYLSLNNKAAACALFQKALTIDPANLKLRLNYRACQREKTS